jgi:hypothetical protein
MKHIITYESYHDKYLNEILDKIHTSGMSSLSKGEKDYLDAYSKDDEEKMTHLEFEKGQRKFQSSDGYFEFQYNYVEDFGDETRYYGILIVPDLEWPNGKRIKGELEGYISVLSNHQIVPNFERDEYDVLEFCNGLEYELDSFLEYVVSTLEDEKIVD